MSQISRGHCSRAWRLAALAATAVLAASAGEITPAAQARSVTLVPEVTVTRDGFGRWDLVNVGGGDNENSGKVKFGWTGRWRFDDLRFTQAGHRAARSKELYGYPPMHSNAVMHFASSSSLTYPNIPQANETCQKDQPDTKTLMDGRLLVGQGHHFWDMYIGIPGPGIADAVPGVASSCGSGGDVPQTSTFFFTDSYLTTYDQNRFPPRMHYANYALRVNFPSARYLISRCERLYAQHPHPRAHQQIVACAHEFDGGVYDDYTDTASCGGATRCERSSAGIIRVDLHFVEP